MQDWQLAFEGQLMFEGQLTLDEIQSINNPGTSNIWSAKTFSIDPPTLNGR